MRWFIFLFLIFPSLLFGREMLVRIYVNSYMDLSPIKHKTINYAGGRPGEYYDIILPERDYYSDLIPSGLPYEIIYSDLDYTDGIARGNYHYYSEVKQLLKDMATNYSAICVFDSIGQTYEGRWIYCVKISDNPGIEDPSEPDMLITGCHHAREWASVEVPLFFADSLTKAYSSNSTIQDIVDSREIWIVPCVNADGYVYDYTGGSSGHMWRKNRQPYLIYMGTDPNRTYNGCCNGDRFGDWGSIPYESAVTHHPDNNVFCGLYGDGPDGNSAPCVDAIVQLVKSHEFNYLDTYHSYSELVLWAWGYTPANPPNNSHLVSYGTAKAALIHRLGGGTYTPSQACGLYPTTGATDDWAYGWYHYVNGTNCVAFTTELGTAFYQPAGDLDYICRENFKGFVYMAQEAANIRVNLDAEVPAPEIAPMDTSATGDYTVYWSPRNPAINNPTKWELHELTGFSSTTDDMESGIGLWDLNGFSLSTAQSHSSNHSFFSGNANNICNTATTSFPYPVKSGDSLSFWCWYDLEYNYDVAVVEVSVDGMEWFQLDGRYSGDQTSWTKKSYSLEPWAGKAVFIRFRAMTDDNTLEVGFYVDDISPVPDFSNDITVSSNITDTSYAFSGKPDNTYWYKVRGSNTSYGWGSFSTLEDIVVTPSGSSEDEKDIVPFSFSALPNPFNTKIRIECSGISGEPKIGLKIYDASGRLVKDFLLPTSNSLLPTVITWDGRDRNGFKLPAGVYYLKLKSGTKHLVKKLILLN